MTLPRKQLVSVTDTPYYHIVSRCVRRTFLCGVDHHSGKSFEHRRLWIEDRIRLLSSLFTIDLCSYAVMSNHYHIVIKMSPAQAVDWPMDEVLSRWCSLYKGPLLVQKYLKGNILDRSELKAVETFASIYRKRLSDLSWFMKCLNEPIARMANREDQCTGHFWESRFKSQALLTEEALLTCMTYVDLNPVRAAMAETPEESAHTSIKERTRPVFDPEKAIKSHIAEGALFGFSVPIKPLLHFEEAIRATDQGGIQFSSAEYLKLVDFTGRAIHPSKRGAIPDQLPSILQRLGVNGQHWVERATQFESLYEQRYSRRRISAKAA